jgi:hypothetical protein
MVMKRWTAVLLLHAYNRSGEYYIKTVISPLMQNTGYILSGCFG